ncbi:hypothetical protein [Kribbella flavida]|uniref:hypothetical protein n=1 Tax=Kribbella flavida TaxID=182640 RepID=UPI00059D7DC5|nr:hypothetical protein [Kribbella flavida]
MSSELARRHRKVQLVVGTIYLGIPVVLLGVGLWLGSGAWTAAVLPVALLAVGAFLLPRHRYRPQRWGVTAAAFGAVAGLFVALYPLAQGHYWPAFLFLPALWAGVVLCVALARYAERTLLVPAVPELADTPYELAFRLRGLRLTTLVLGKDSVTIQSIPLGRRGPKPADLARTYPLSKVTGVYDVSLTGAERLRFPVALPIPAVGTAGPAVILQAAGDDWVLPTDLAPTLAQLLTHRVNSTTDQELGDEA